MAKVQTRRSISVNGALAARFQSWCAEHGASMSSIVEGLLVDLEGGPLPGPCEKREATRRPYPRANDEARLERLRTWRVDAPPSLVGQGVPRLRDSVALQLSHEAYDLVSDSLGDLRLGQKKQPDQSREIGAALDAAITRMLDAYDAVAARAGHCAICRVRSRNAKPFVPMLAGDGVVAVCRTCVAEGRRLDGSQQRRSA